jgi:hypothetical protein
MKAGNVLKLAAPSYVSNHPEHLRNDIIDNLNVLLTSAETFNTDLAAAQANTTLSAEGRTAAAARVAAAALATLTAIENTTIKKLTDHATSLEVSLLNKATYIPPKDPAERIAHELHLQEIRSQLRLLPLAERTNVYRTSTDPLVLAAIDTAPMTLSAPRADGSRRLEHFIDPDERTAAKLARAEAADPAAATMLRDTRSLAEVYRLAVNGVRREIFDEVPDAAPAAHIVTV